MVLRDQNVKQVAMMKYPLVQWLVVYENMVSKVQQIIEMESKIIGAIGSTYSVGKEGIDQGYQTESGHCCGDTHLDIYGCEAWTLQARHKGHIQATQMRVLSWTEG